MPVVPDNTSEEIVPTHTRAELEEQTYDELMELAREQDVTGRSSMNKAELIDALAED